MFTSTMKKATTAAYFLALLMQAQMAVGQSAAGNDTLATAAHFSGGSADKVTEERMNKGLVTNSLSALSGQAVLVAVSEIMAELA